MTYISPTLNVSEGFYTGNNAQNRAIAHGLGATPSKTFICGNVGALCGIKIFESGFIQNSHAGGDTRFVVTAADDTNFYVGDSTNNSGGGNNSAYIYYWIAFPYIPPHLKVSEGFYTGNNAQNRAIAHGLGITPSKIFICGNVGALSGIKIFESGFIQNSHGSGDTRFVVTAADDTNFYVGDSTNDSGGGNNSTYIYFWIAFL